MWRTRRRPCRRPFPRLRPRPRLRLRPRPRSASASERGAAVSSDSPLPVPTELAQAHPGGLTASQAASRAATTSWNAKAAEENLRGAAARLDESWAAFLPRLQLVGKYTRLSDFPSPAFFSAGSGNFVATNAPPGLIPPGGNASFASVPGNLRIPFFTLDNWLFQAGITVPISDYLLRIDQNYTSATRSQDAARWDVVTARAGSQSNGEGQYYTWLRARGTVIVAVQALNDQKTHLRDARNQFAVGNASKADVLSAETSVAAAELAHEQALEPCVPFGEAAPGRHPREGRRGRPAGRGPRHARGAARGQREAVYQ